MSQSNKHILLDADVLSHFMASGNVLLLNRIFKNKKVVLKIVADEVRRHPGFRPYIDQLISLGHINEIPMPGSSEILREFAQLRKTKGDGESACMAVARYNPNIIASNNWRDVKSYCELHCIEYLSTMDFIYEAYRIKLMDLSECDHMIYKLLTLKNPAKLPCIKLEEYCRKNNKVFPIK